RQMSNNLWTIERDVEQKPQRRASAVDGSRAHSARCQMQQVASDIFPGRSIGRAPKKNGKVLDAPNVISLCLCHEIADRHVFNHAPPQRADALIGHGILLSEPRLLTLDLQTGRRVPLSRFRQPRAPPCAKRSTARAVSFTGTSRTSQDVRLESAKWGKADLDQVADTRRNFMSTRLVTGVGAAARAPAGCVAPPPRSARPKRRHRAFSF